MKIAIYALRDRTGIRYVGRAQNPALRLRQHLSERGSSPKCVWLDELRRRGERPELVVLELVPALEAPRREERWIRRLFGRGVALVNVQGSGKARKPAAAPRRRRSPAELFELWESFSFAGSGQVL